MSATDTTVTVTVLDTPGDLRGFLRAACPPGPSLHPDVNSDDPWKRWNGWNQAHAVGIDADGVPFQADVSAYASGWDSMSLGRIGTIPHGAVTDEDAESRTGLRFPVRAFPALSILLHPEHTPEV